VSYSWSRAAARAIVGKPCADAADPVIDLRINGATVAPWQAFRVTVNSSLAGGGNQFYVLHSGSDPLDGEGDADALAAHLGPSLTGAPLLPPARDRITLVP
jgi:5'-nucleotidase